MSQAGKSKSDMGQSKKAELKYDNKIVAFLDILGFKNLVANGNISIILNAMDIISRRLKMIENVPEVPIRRSQFSDSLILSSARTDEGVIHLVHFTSMLISELFLHGIWCRGGGLALGDMLHNGEWHLVRH
jgi:hypothetical protein